MKTFLVLHLTFFSALTFANGALVEDDVIMRESLKKQGVPAPLSMEQRQESGQEIQQQIEDMQNRIQALQRQVDKLKDRDKQMRQEESEPVGAVTRVEIKNGLRAAKEKGAIGKYSIMEGKASATAFKKTEESSERSIPALQICATMADANRMSEEDFAFMGFDPKTSKKIVESRDMLGGFTSSKQISEVEGVTPQDFQVAADYMIAIKEKLAE